MKTKLVLLFLALAATSFAAEAAVAISTGNASADSILTWLIPVIVPLILAGLKKIAPAVPAWTLPILAPVLGVVVDLVNHYALGHTSNLAVSIGLGLAGVGLREVKENLLPATNGGWPTTPPPEA